MYMRGCDNNGMGSQVPLLIASDDYRLLFKNVELVCFLSACSSRGGYVESQWPLTVGSFQSIMRYFGV